MNLAGEAPGPVEVKITTPTGDFLDKTLFTYEDPRKRPGEHTLPNKRRLIDHVDELGKILKQIKKDVTSDEIEKLDTQQKGESNISN